VAGRAQVGRGLLVLGATITTTYDSVKVTCPMACASVPSPIPPKRRRNSSSSATPITISGVTSGSSISELTVPLPRPRQR
jgi:hypothetical protein